MSRGRFITFEGIEGAGKTTQVKALVEHLLDSGLNVVQTREPGGTPLGESIRSLILADGEVDPGAELLLMFGLRAQHVAQIIRPALEAGHWVVSDRFTDATYAYQGGGRGLDMGFIAALESWVQNELQPDLTFLLDVPVELALARTVKRGPLDRFEGETVAFFERARSVYLARAEQFPHRIKRIDGTGSVEAIFAESVHLASALM